VETTIKTINFSIGYFKVFFISLFIYASISISQEGPSVHQIEYEKYKNETNHNYLHTPKWNTADGNYTKLPWSIEPGTELGYGRNLVAMQDKTSLNYYRETKERFFYDMVINSINHLENSKRGLYSGAIGYLSANGNMDFALAIRTMILKDGMAYIQAGAGIVYDSNPEMEFEETTSFPVKNRIASRQ